MIPDFIAMKERRKHALALPLVWQKVLDLTAYYDLDR